VAEGERAEHVVKNTRVRRLVVDGFTHRLWRYLRVGERPRTCIHPVCCVEALVAVLRINELRKRGAQGGHVAKHLDVRAPHVDQIPEPPR